MMETYDDARMLVRRQALRDGGAINRQRAVSNTILSCVESASILYGLVNVDGVRNQQVIDLANGIESRIRAAFCGSLGVDLCPPTGDQWKKDDRVAVRLDRGLYKMGRVVDPMADGDCAV